VRLPPKDGRVVWSWRPAVGSLLASIRAEHTTQTRLFGLPDSMDVSDVADLLEHAHVRSTPGRSAN